MNKYNYIKNILICSFSVGFLFASCTEDSLDRVNDKNDLNNPLNMQAKFLVTDLETSTAFQVVGGDFSLYSSVYMEHETGTHNQMYNAETRNGEPIAISTYDNTWNSAYSNIKKAKIVIKKCSPGGTEANSDITLGIGRVLLAYNAAVLTDLFGDTPYTQAGVVDDRNVPVYMNPIVDKQEDIYKDVMAQLDSAITLFQNGKDNGVYGAIGSKDFFYNGSKESWLKAAYGLRARYTMRLLYRSTNQTQDLTNILTDISNSFTSADEELKFSIYNGGSQNNPLYSFSDTRAAFGASMSFATKLKERNDPRYLGIYMNYNNDTGVFENITKASKFNPAPNYIVGTDTLTQEQLVYSLNKTDFSPSAPTQLLSYHELLFLKAEAYARLGDNTNAESALKDAITAGFANLEVAINSTNAYDSNIDKLDLSAVVSSNYYTTSVQPLFSANPLKEIMIQKYFAFMGASGESIEAYNDYRRLKAMGENFIQLANPLNTYNPSNKTGFPLRFIYGSSDASSNPNIKPLVSDVTYVYRDNVWWAGGTK